MMCFKVEPKILGSEKKKNRTSINWIIKILKLSNDKLQAAFGKADKQ